MSGLGFSESAFELKLAEFTGSQTSVEVLSAWLIRHREHHHRIVKIWYKEFWKVQDHRKLSFVHLAYNVIQDSRWMGSEYVKSFAPLLKKTFDHMATLPSKTAKKSILEIFKIWENYQIYHVFFVRDLVSSYWKTWNDLHGHEAELQERLNDDDDLQKIPQEPSASTSKLKGFSKSAFRGMLAELTGSQTSVKDLSAWIENHKIFHIEIVHIWYKEFLNAQEHRKLFFVYLANDVIQNSRRKGGEFVKSFSLILEDTFDHMAWVPAEETKISMLRVLRIWEVRGIYDANLIRDLESSYQKTWNDLHVHEPELQEPLNDNDDDDDEKIHHDPQDKSNRDEQRKHYHSCPSSGEEVPHSQQRATVIRLKPASFPTEASDMSGVDEICVKHPPATKLQERISAFADLLHNFNEKLDKELEDRKEASRKLQDLIHFQKTSLTQAEHRVKEHQHNLKILGNKIGDVKAHMLTMPVLPKLSSVDSE